VSNAFQGAQVALGLRKSMADIANVDADTANKLLGPSGTIPQVRDIINKTVASKPMQSALTSAKEAAKSIPGYDAPHTTGAVPGNPGVSSDPFAGLPNYGDAKKTVQSVLKSISPWISPATTSLSPGNPGSSTLTEQQLKNYAIKNNLIPKLSNRVLSNPSPY